MTKHDHFCIFFTEEPTEHDNTIQANWVMQNLNTIQQHDNHSSYKVKYGCPRLFSSSARGQDVNVLVTKMSHQNTMTKSNLVINRRSNVISFAFFPPKNWHNTTAPSRQSTSNVTSSLTTTTQSTIKCHRFRETMQNLNTISQHNTVQLLQSIKYSLRTWKYK